MYLGNGVSCRFMQVLETFFTITTFQLKIFYDLDEKFPWKQQSVVLKIVTPTLRYRLKVKCSNMEYLEHIQLETTGVCHQCKSSVFIILSFTIHTKILCVSLILKYWSHMVTHWGKLHPNLLINGIWQYYDKKLHHNNVSKSIWNIW